MQLLFIVAIVFPAVARAAFVVNVRYTGTSCNMATMYDRMMIKKKNCTPDEKMCIRHGAVAMSKQCVADLSELGVPLVYIQQFSNFSNCLGEADIHLTELYDVCATNSRLYGANATHMQFSTYGSIDCSGTPLATSAFLLDSCYTVDNISVLATLIQ